MVFEYKCFENTTQNVTLVKQLCPIMSKKDVDKING